MLEVAPVVVLARSPLLRGVPMIAGAALLLWACAVVGLTAIVTCSKVAAPLRRSVPWLPLGCPMCVGWWVGFALACVPRAGLAWWASQASPYVAPWLDAAAASWLSWAAHVVLVRLGAREL